MDFTVITCLVGHFIRTPTELLYLSDSKASFKKEVKMLSPTDRRRAKPATFVIRRRAILVPGEPGLIPRFEPAASQHEATQRLAKYERFLPHTRLGRLHCESARIALVLTPKQLTHAMSILHPPEDE